MDGGNEGRVNLIASSRFLESEWCGRFRHDAGTQAKRQKEDCARRPSLIKKTKEFRKVWSQREVFRRHMASASGTKPTEHLCLLGKISNLKTEHDWACLSPWLEEKSRTTRSRSFTQSFQVAVALEAMAQQQLQQQQQQQTQEA